MRGRMVFDGAERSRGVLTMLRPGSGRPARLEMVADGTVMYMRSGLFHSLPDGKEWVKVDYSAALGLDGPVPGGGDVKGELGLLEGAGGEAQKLGREDVRGVATTRYRSTIEPSALAQRIREAGGEDAADRIEKEGSPTEVEAWIDGDGLVRRMRIVMVQPQDEGEDVTMHMRSEFFDFGLETEIEPPDSDEVFDATSLAAGEPFSRTGSDFSWLRKPDSMYTGAPAISILG